MAKKKEKSKKSTKFSKTKISKPQSQNQNLPTIMDVFSPPFMALPWRGLLGNKGEWVPAIYFSEEKDMFVAKVDLPGVHEEDVNVAVLGDMLVVEGEKQSQSEVKKKGYYYNETSYGSFSRSISIPSVVDVEKITANFHKGVLEIDLPKSAEVQPKKVSVTTEKKAKAGTKNEIPSINKSVLENDLSKTPGVPSKKVSATIAKKAKAGAKNKIPSINKGALESDFSKTPEVPSKKVSATVEKKSKVGAKKEAPAVSTVEGNTEK